MELTGRVALVTGANRGVGAALVDALLERGAAKVYAAARATASLAAVCAPPRPGISRRGRRT